ncbi:MAG: sulfite exporter TauE/SafE family protein [Bryobacteraceae bacterium]
MPIPELVWSRWLLGCFCAFSVGVAKTGVPGLGILAIPLMVLAVGDARLSAGWLLPILCVADVFAIWYYRRHAALWQLFSLAPWVLVGMAIGAATLSLDEHYLRRIVAVVVLVMLAAYLRRRLNPNAKSAPGHSMRYGVTAGFATTVANAAGPVMNLYLLSKKLPKEEFIATGAWFFFVINLSKLPIYTWHGLISPESLSFNVLMIPAVIAGALTGRWVITRIAPRVFEALVVGLTAAATLLLFR